MVKGMGNRLAILIATAIGSSGTVLAEPTVRSSPRKQTGQQGLDSLSLARVEWTVLNDW